MVNIISTTTPSANGPRAMTLQALKARQAELELQQAQAAKPHEVTSIPQGLGDIANAFFTARRGDYLQNKENQTRDTLAKMRAGWGPEGPTQQQVAEYSAIDPEYGNKIGEDVMKAAQDRAAQDRLFGNQKTLQDDQQGFTAGQNEADRSVQTAGQQSTREVADAQLKQSQAKQDYTEAHPDIQSVPQALAALQEGKFGPVGSPEAKANYDAVVAKLNALPAGGNVSSTSITGYDDQGRPLVETSYGPRQGGGGGAGSIGGGGGDQKTMTKTLDDYARESQAASAQNTQFDVMEKALPGVGPIGGGALTEGIGAIGDIAEAGMDAAGIDKGWLPDWLGSSANRAILRGGSLASVQKQVASYKGAISDKETELFRAAGPGLNQTREGNRALINIGRAFNARSIERAQAAHEWAATGGPGKGTLAGFDQYWANKDAANPILTTDPKTGELIAGGRGLGVTEVGQQVSADQPQAAPQSQAPQPQGGGAVARPTTDAEFNALAPGTTYIDPDDGKTYRK